MSAAKSYWNTCSSSPTCKAKEGQWITFRRKLKQWKGPPPTKLRISLFPSFQGITTDIAYKQPEDPIDYMIEEIEKLQEQDRRRKGVVRVPISKLASAKQHAEADNSQSWYNND